MVFKWVQKVTGAARLESSIDPEYKERVLTLKRWLKDDLMHLENVSYMSGAITQNGNPDIAILQALTRIAKAEKISGTQYSEDQKQVLCERVERELEAIAYDRTGIRAEPRRYR